MKSRPAPVIWFTGLSGAGKSTICRAVLNRLADRNLPVEVLDGDDVRKTFCSDLGFSQHDRRENLLRISYVAGLLSRHGVIVLVATISPFRQVRDEVRRHHPRFLEVFVNAPLAVCERRDPKGLYRRARAGTIENFTGVSAPYERPLTPDVECRTDLESVEASSSRVMQSLANILEDSYAEASHGGC